MNRKLLSAIALLALALYAHGDVIKLRNGGSLEGVVVSEDADHITVRMQGTAATLSRTEVASIEKRPYSPPPGPRPAAQRLPDVNAVVDSAHATGWGKALEQIPATVITTGVMANVPYVSYQAGDYEVNVYGNPQQPSGIEIGIHNGLLTSPDAKANCIGFITGLLDDENDRAVMGKLRLAEDVKRRGGLTFEVTDPNAPDAYGGWWVSVYDEKGLRANRATPKELGEISVPRTASPANGPDAQSGEWTSSDLSRSRPPQPSAATHAPGAVYVRAYYRRDGTYVNGYARSAPHRR